MFFILGSQHCLQLPHSLFWSGAGQVLSSGFVETVDVWGQLAIAGWSIIWPENLITRFAGASGRKCFTQASRVGIQCFTCGVSLATAKILSRCSSSLRRRSRATWILLIFLNWLIEPLHPPTAVTGWPRVFDTVQPEPLGIHNSLLMHSSLNRQSPEPWQASSLFCILQLVNHTPIQASLKAWTARPLFLMLRLFS